MRLAGTPLGVVDWRDIAEQVLPGESGSAAQRGLLLGETQIRVVDYRPGYVADHWCGKGHILFVLSGALSIEHQDGARYELRAGMGWHVGEDMASAHRVVCEGGAQVFIVD